jgi:hypothetical protein
MKFIRSGAAVTVLLFGVTLAACGGSRDPEPSEPPTSTAVRLAFLVQPANTTAGALISISVKS